MTLSNIVAIDGPAASGKTTLAIGLAEFLDYLYFDTGVMYRAITFEALRGRDTLPDEQEIVAIAEQTQIEVRPPSITDGRYYDVICAGNDITQDIRNPEVDANVSAVSAIPGVRKALTQQQRRIGKQGKVVMVGRDIGTIVLPEAELKIFLNASIEERARRRHAEALELGETRSYSEILEAMRKRDLIDSTREVAPLEPAEDAVVLNSDGLSAKEVLAKVKLLLEKRVVRENE